MRVLVVDDQEAVRVALQLLLEIHGFAVTLAPTTSEALEAVQTEDIGVVIQDMNFTRDTTSGEEGVELFRRIRALDPELPVILMTAWTSLETAVALVKEGAADYQAKPWDDRKLVVTVQNLMQLREARQAHLRLASADERARRDLREHFDLRGIVYRSRAMHEAVSLAVHVAPAEAPVLITGPNGSGKEKIAEIIQANSRRAGKPFVSVNAGGLPDQLLDAELFGAEAGAFTGAAKLRIGRFEAADEGTFFLDELGNLSMMGQMKLLRVLQTGEYQRLGSSATRRANVRLISATNADLPHEIRAGRFREDLFFRLNVIEVNLPPLAERSEDILPLASHFLRKHGGPNSPELNAAACAALEAHDWPGNVRELENCVQRAVLVAGRGPIEPQHLGLSRERDSSVALPLGSRRNASEPPSSAGAVPHAPPQAGEGRWCSDDGAEKRGGALEDAERAAIEAALRDSSGVISRAAATLGISRQALYRRMERFGLTMERTLR